MNRYLVKLVYQIICGDGQHTAQFDEQLRLLTAADDEEALHKSRRIGLQEEEIFYNSRRQMVQWKFINAVELYPVQDLGDGAEVFSQIKESDDAEGYCRFLHHKAAGLRRRVTSTPQTV